MMWIHSINLKVTLCLLCLSSLLTSCASTSETEIPGGVYLAEVSFILTKDQIIADQLGTRKFKDFYSSIIADGFTDNEIDAGQVIAIRGSIYWINTFSGIKHARHTVALLPKGMQVDPGNIVEVRDPGSPHFYTVERVRARNAKDGQCGYVQVFAPLPWQITKDIIGLLSFVGPSGDAALYCKGIENEGWKEEGGYWTKTPTPSSNLSK